MMRQIKQPTFAELYAPKLLSVLREGYGASDFRADVIAGLPVAIVALPLSMAIAIASGVTPDRGLYTAIVGASASPRQSLSSFLSPRPFSSSIHLTSNNTHFAAYSALMIGKERSPALQR